MLNNIYEHINKNTDSQTQQILMFLLNKSFVPYIEILGKGIYEGIIDDLFEEFLIFERKDIGKDIEKDM